MASPKTADGAVAPKRQRPFRQAVENASAQDILLFLVAFRIVNALSVKTFFQPDEHFQSLEPAWQMVFGKESGAWITWEWEHQLRSSIHPAIFAGVYYITSALSDFLSLSPSMRAQLLLAAPKVFQAVIAALGDYYTWKLSERVFGRGSRTAWMTLALTVCSPWQWFCSTRTLSNCLETTLTATALSLWPWQWQLAATESHVRDDSGLRVPKINAREGDVDELTKLRRCLILAGLACILRPTNLMIWASITLPLLLHATKTERFVLVREVVICGGLVLALSVLADRIYYQKWTFPPARFLCFNIAQSLSVFYGRNDWHYYLSQGLPLLLTTALPFGLLGLWRALYYGHFVRLQLAITTTFVIATLSVISHKEVRFIYPLLPALHLLAAECFTNTIIPEAPHYNPTPSPNIIRPWLRNLLIGILLAPNIAIAVFTTQNHQSGVLNVLGYLRGQHEAKLALNNGNATSTVYFLMPCHSTPWRSHLIHPTINAGALSCDPPVNMPPEEREVYLDEADVFYANPLAFLRKRFVPPGRTSLERTKSIKGKKTIGSVSWPEYVVFFEQLEPVIKDALAGSRYEECWRGFNTYWHDDWRRKGDVIVWCLKGEGDS